MKKFLLPLLALALSATAASAQSAQPDQMASPQEGGRPRRSPEEMAANQTKRLTKELGLSADQSTKVQQIMLARTQEMQAMRGQMQTGGDRSQMRDQMKANRTKYDDQFKAVLTPDQYTKFTAMQEEQRGRGRGRGPENMDGKVKEKDGKVKIKTKKTDS